MVKIFHPQGMGGDKGNPSFVGLSSSLPRAIVDMLIYCEYPCLCITQCGGRRSCRAICKIGENMPSDKQLMSLGFWARWAYPKLIKNGYTIKFEKTKCTLASEEETISEDADDTVASFCWALQTLIKRK